jgi:SpoVK/Ycf46/Vps4 family AAA+-type ATPase
MSELNLLETKHPDKHAAQRYGALVGIDDQKRDLLDELTLLLDGGRLDAWLHKHHPGGLSFVDAWGPKIPFVLLSGEVGCGKTALATSIATPLAEQLQRRVVCLETPSDIRGWGRVGEISARITEAFTQAKSKAKHMGLGLLVIDEGDDLATSRAQMQAHHEDRAGVNVLLKQIDLLAREETPLAVLLVTNRAATLDPAIMRRAALHLRFDRPSAAARRAIFGSLLRGTKHRTTDIEELVVASEHATVPYSFSDLTARLAQAAMRRAWSSDQPFGATALKEALHTIEPSPLVEGPRGA